MGEKLLNLMYLWLKKKTCPDCRVNKQKRNWGRKAHSSFVLAIFPLAHSHTLNDVAFLGLIFFTGIKFSPFVLDTWKNDKQEIKIRHQKVPQAT